jgi:hypothetical protein
MRRPPIIKETLQCKSSSSPEAAVNIPLWKYNHLKVLKSQNNYFNQYFKWYARDGI